MDEATTRVILGLMETIERQNRLIQNLIEREPAQRPPTEDAEAARRRHLQTTVRSVDRVLGVERPSAVGE